MKLTNADTIAGQAGIKHTSVNRAISRHKNDFLAFGDLRVRKHGHQITYLLNQRQTFLLVMILKNRYPAMNLKRSLVMAMN